LLFKKRVTRSNLLTCSLQKEPFAHKTAKERIAHFFERKKRTIRSKTQRANAQPW